MASSFVLVTGATSGIGLAAAREFAKLGKNLALLGRRADRLESIRAEFVRDYGVEVRVFAADVCDRAQMDAVFEDLSDVGLEALVNNAWLAAGKENFLSASWDDLERMIDVNVRGFTYVAWKAAPLIARSKGHIFNLGSIAGVEAYEWGHAYCASKAYVHQLSKALRIDLMGTGARVTEIAPGAVETEFSLVRFREDAGKASAVYEGYVPLSADDVAACILAAYRMPASVNVEYMLVMPTAQASATRVHRESH